MAVNLFKSMLLEEGHRPGEPQSELIWSHFHDVRQRKQDVLDERTWMRWFEPERRSTQPHKYEVLDRILERALEPSSSVDAAVAPPRATTFISSLASQGLVAELLAPTKSANPVHTISARAADYRPVSMLHLHVDAIEAAALATGNGDVPWETVKLIAAKRILELLHERWNPRTGTVYAQLSSNLSVSLQQHDAMLYEAERRDKRATGRIERRMSSPAAPAWDITNVASSEASIHMHRVLLALAADARFLVADRFEVWFLDLATAAVAMFALAWCERTPVFGRARISDEEVYWRAFDHLFFREMAQAPSMPTGDADDEEWQRAHAEILAGLDCTGAQWERCSLDILLQAGVQYRALLNELNVSAASVRSDIVSCTAIHRLRFRG